MLGRCSPLAIKNFCDIPKSIRTMWFYSSTMMLSSFMSAWTYPSEWRFWMHFISSTPIKTASLLLIFLYCHNCLSDFSRYPYTIKQLPSLIQYFSDVDISLIYPKSKRGTIPFRPFLQTFFAILSSSILDCSSKKTLTATLF